jgi:hypothetical protein
MKDELLVGLSDTKVSVSANVVTGGKSKPPNWDTWTMQAKAAWIRLNGPPVKNGGLLTSSGVKRYANGGLLPRFYEGGKTQMYPNGMLSGPGGPRTDSILARVSTGEFVVNAAATRRNLDLLQAINSNKTISGETATTNNNISINVNAAPGMNEQEVANLVSQKLNFELSRGMNA